VRKHQEVGSIFNSVVFKHQLS